jgi:serine/threonine-protein kinase
MGTIYRAHDPDIDRIVAIKLIRADLLDGADRTEFISRFRHEAQAAGRCSHQNIVSIYDFALHDGNPFLAMEFVKGSTLAQAVQGRRQMAVIDAVTVVLQVLDALQAAHATGIVHRDIKPANIMLTESGRVKVTDFGISRIETSNLTVGDVVIGTPNYMSPEQCNAQVVDARSDLFSMGVVFYELLAGQRPFAGANATQVFAKLLYEAPADLRGIRPEVSGPLWAVIARSLEKRPADRFATAADMAAAITAAGGAVAEKDQTVALPPAARLQEPVTPGPGTSTRLGSSDPQLVASLSRKLGEFIGPIARHMVLDAMRGTDNFDTLLGQLAACIERPDDRQRFEREVRRETGLSSLAAAMTSDPISPAEVERAQTALARHLGPVARVLVKRALGGAADVQAFWLALAANIDDPKQRAAFLQSAQTQG